MARVEPAEYRCAFHQSGGDGGDSRHEDGEGGSIINGPSGVCV
jgi:hypothetical protein